MNFAISAARTKDIKVNRHELVTSLQKKGHSVVYIGQESNTEIHTDYSRLGVSFLSIPLKRDNTNPLQEIKTIKKTASLLKKNNIEVLISYGIRTFPTMVLAAKLAGIKKILCVVNGSGQLFQLKGLKGNLVKGMAYPMLWLSFQLSTSIIIQNNDDAKMLRKKNLLMRNNYTVVKGSGVNLKEFEFTELEKDPVFSMISRLTASKGVNEYIKAAKKVKDIYPKATFYLIGPLEEDENIEMNELKDAVEKKVINLIGKVEDVRSYINQCRVFVLPSYYPEGVPRSIVEAMALGRPVITTNTPGCKETVIEKFNGLIASPKDPNSLAEKIIWMIENDDKLEELGRNSRAMCEENFDVHKVNSVMMESLDL